MMKKFAVLIAVALLVVSAGVASAFVYTNQLGQVVTATISEGAYATVSTGATTPTYVTQRAGINVFTDTSAAPDVTAAVYTNTATIGDMLIGTVSNKVWVLTAKGTWTAVN